MLFALVAQAGDAPGDKALAPFTLKDSSGVAYNVGKHIGKDVIIVAFWATWCKPCKIELAALRPLYEKYKKQGLVLLAVSIDGPDSIAEVTNYTRKFGYTFPVLLDSETEILERYNPRGDVPFSMVIDRQGHIVETHQGYNPGDEVSLEVKLIELLGGEASGVTKPGSEAERMGYWIPPRSPHLEGTESLELRYLVDNQNNTDADDGVFGIVNRLTLGGASGPFSLGIRSDNVAFPGYEVKKACEGESLANCPWVDDHRIERFWAQYRTNKLSVRGGDFYGSLGRGMVFSVRKIDELGLDTAIRGGRASGTIGPVTLTALGGVSNVRNVDLAKDGFIEDPDDTAVGGEVTIDLPYKMTLGLRGSYFDYKEAYDEDAFRKEDEGDWTVGGSFEMREVADMVTLYFEGVFIRNESQLDTKVIGQEDRKVEDQSADGRGLYGSVAINPVEGMALLLEFKDYHRFVLRKPGPDKGVPVVYHEAPTMERYDQIVQYTANGTGGRLLAEYYIKPIGLLVFANALYYGWALDEEFTFEEDVDVFGDRGFTTLHAYGGLEKRWESGLYVNVSAGYRLEKPNAIEADEPDFHRKVLHFEADVQIPLGGKHSLGIRSQSRKEEQNKAGSLKDFWRGDLAVTYGLAPALSFGFLWTYQTEFDNQEELANFAGEIVWRFSEWGQWSVFGGQNTGGLICVSGVCRNFPPFFGVRSEFVARF